ncbi:putative holin-like toxin [Bacillus chungangensis]
MTIYESLQLMITFTMLVLVIKEKK